MNYLILRIITHNHFVIQKHIKNKLILLLLAVANMISFQYSSHYEHLRLGDHGSKILIWVCSPDINWRRQTPKATLDHSNESSTRAHRIIIKHHIAIVTGHFLLSPTVIKVNALAGFSRLTVHGSKNSQISTL